MHELSLDQMSKWTKCLGVRNVIGVQNVLLPFQRHGDNAKVEQSLFADNLQSKSYLRIAFLCIDSQFYKANSRDQSSQWEPIKTLFT